MPNEYCHKYGINGVDQGGARFIRGGSLRTFKLPDDGTCIGDMKGSTVVVAGLGIVARLVVGRLVVAGLVIGGLGVVGVLVVVALVVGLVVGLSTQLTMP